VTSSRTTGPRRGCRAGAGAAADWSVAGANVTPPRTSKSLGRPSSCTRAGWRGVHPSTGHESERGWWERASGAEDRAGIGAEDRVGVGTEARGRAGGCSGDCSSRDMCFEQTVCPQLSVVGASSKSRHEAQRKSESRAEGRSGASEEVFCGGEERPELDEGMVEVECR
jgi:hypothetical protein